MNLKSLYFSIVLIVSNAVQPADSSIIKGDNEFSQLSVNSANYGSNGRIEDEKKSSIVSPALALPALASQASTARSSYKPPQLLIDTENNSFVNLSPDQTRKDENNKKFENLKRLIQREHKYTHFSFILDKISNASIFFTATVPAVAILYEHDMGSKVSAILETVGFASDLCSAACELTQIYYDGEIKSLKKAQQHLLHTMAIEIEIETPINQIGDIPFSPEISNLYSTIYSPQTFPNQFSNAEFINLEKGRIKELVLELDKETKYFKYCTFIVDKLSTVALIAERALPVIAYLFKSYLGNTTADRMRQLGLLSMILYGVCLKIEFDGEAKAKKIHNLEEKIKKHGLKKTK